MAAVPSSAHFCTALQDTPMPRHANVNSHRRKVFSLLTALLICLTGCQPDGTRASALSEIRSVFSEFQQALEDQDGEAALETLTSSSIDKYEKLRTAALHASEASLREMELLEQAEILKLRHSFTADELNAMNGRDLLARLIDDGSLASELISRARLGEAVFKEDRCLPKIYDGGSPTNIRLEFHSEKDGWKLHLPSADVASKQAIRSMMDRDDLDHEGVLRKIMKDLTGSEDDQSLLKPLDA